MSPRRKERLNLDSTQTVVGCSLYRVSEVPCPLFRLTPQGKEVSQESVKQFYESRISRQNTLSSLGDQDDSLPPPLSPPTAVSSRYAYAKWKNQASKGSLGSSFSRSLL